MAMPGDKLGVTGSSPVPPTQKDPGNRGFSFSRARTVPAVCSAKCLHPSARIALVDGASYYARRSARDPEWRDAQIADTRERERRRFEEDPEAFRAAARERHAATGSGSERRTPIAGRRSPPPTRSRNGAAREALHRPGCPILPRGQDLVHAAVRTALLPLGSDVFLEKYAHRAGKRLCRSSERDDLLPRNVLQGGSRQLLGD
jgi:hypothetical protein